MLNEEAILQENRGLHRPLIGGGIGENELEREATVKPYLMVQTEGDREVQRKVNRHIAIELRLDPQDRLWPTSRLLQLILLAAPRQRHVHRLPRQVRGEELDEVVFVAPQVAAAPHAEARGVGAEEVFGIEGG